MTLAERLARILRLPRIAVLPAVVAGASASYDPSLRPQWGLLVSFAVFLFAIADAEATLMHGLARGTRGRFFAALAVAAFAAATLVILRGWPMFWVVAAAGMMATAFVAGPRLADTAAAGPTTIVWMGPLASAGAALALVGIVAPPALWIGVPIGFLADAARRAHGAARTERHPEALAPEAPPWFAGDLVAAFGVVPVLILANGLPFVTLLALAGLPWLALELARARGAYPWRDAAVRTRLLHAGVALVLAATTLAARIIATRAA